MAYSSSTTYLQYYRRYLVAVSRRRNDHMQVYIIIMECFQCCLSVENSTSVSLQFETK